MNADDFRDYMLSLLFLRYLSDNYEPPGSSKLWPRCGAAFTGSADCPHDDLREHLGRERVPAGRSAPRHGPREAKAEVVVASVRRDAAAIRRPRDKGADPPRPTVRVLDAYPPSLSRMHTNHPIPRVAP